MPKQTIMQIISDDLGKLFLDATSPPQVYLGTNPPHSVGIRVGLASQEHGANGIEAWIVVSRKDAYLLLQRLSDRLLEATRIGAEEITNTLQFSAVLSSDADLTSGKLQLRFIGAKSGLKYLVEIPRDQSGPLIDAITRAATKAAEIADKKLLEAGSGIILEEASPREAEVIELKYDALTKKEFLVVRLAKGVEYSFILSESQAIKLRQSQRPPANTSSAKN